MKIVVSFPEYTLLLTTHREGTHGCGRGVLMMHCVETTLR